MNRYSIVGLCLLLPILLDSVQGQSFGWEPKFYPYCVEMGVSGVKSHSFPEHIQMFKEIGFDGAGCFPMWLGADMEKNLKIVDDAGMQVYMFGYPLSLKAENVYDPRLPDAIRKLKGRPTTVCVSLGGFKPGDPAGMEPAVKALRELGDVAAEAGVRISIYQHVGDWTESLPFVVEVVKKVDHPRVGFNFNLCHWLKVDGKSDYRPLLRDNAAKLFVVMICGAQTDAKSWTNGLTQPLDKGDFDNGQLLATLAQIGYRGPVGLMCYGIPDNAREHLTRSMAVWRKLKENIR